MSGLGGGGGMRLGVGPTTVADNTTVTVLADQAIAAGEIPVFDYWMKTISTNLQRHLVIKPVDVNSTACTGFTKKDLVTGDCDFIIKHKDGAARDFDWRARKFDTS